MAAEHDSIGNTELRGEPLDLLHQRAEAHEMELDVARLHRSHRVQCVLDALALDQPRDADEAHGLLRLAGVRRADAARAQAVRDHIEMDIPERTTGERAKGGAVRDDGSRLRQYLSGYGTEELVEHAEQRRAVVVRDVRPAQRHDVGETGACSPVAGEETCRKREVEVCKVELALAKELIEAPPRMQQIGSGSKHPRVMRAAPEAWYPVNLDAAAVLHRRLVLAARGQHHDFPTQARELPGHEVRGTAGSAAERRELVVEHQHAHQVLRCLGWKVFTLGVGRASAAKALSRTSQAKNRPTRMSSRLSSSTEPIRDLNRRVELLKTKEML